MTTAEIRKIVDDLELDCHPDWVNSRFFKSFRKALEEGKKFVARSTSSTGIGRYWEVSYDGMDGGTLIYASSDHDSPGEDAKSDCEKLNKLIEGRR